LIEPEDDGRGDGDGGHEGVRASIVAGVDATPSVLKPTSNQPIGITASVYGGP
jgi:hypothetical protein